MSTLMGKAMTDVDLVWVIPKVKDLEYPAGEYADPIEVTIFGEVRRLFSRFFFSNLTSPSPLFFSLQSYLIEVESHIVDNITYYILDSPVFRAQTKSDPCTPNPSRLFFPSSSR
jgi:alpha-1,3-glucan synthase